MKNSLLIDPLARTLSDTLFTITDSRKDAIVAVFMDWLTKYARLKPAPDIPDRIAKIEPRLRKLAKNLSVCIEREKIVIRTDADSQALLDSFRRGTSWFEPHPDVNAAIMLALANGGNAS